MNKIDNNDDRVNALAGHGGQFNDNSAIRVPAVYGMTITLNASEKNDVDYGITTNFTGDNHAIVKLRDGETLLPDQGTITNDGKTITTSYDYDGWQFCIEATVDAVQDHNAEDAIKSAWGRDVTISDGTLQLD